MKDESGIKPNIIRDYRWSPKVKKYLDVVKVKKNINIR